MRCTVGCPHADPGIRPVSPDGRTCTVDAFPGRPPAEPAPSRCVHRAPRDRSRNPHPLRSREPPGTMHCAPARGSQRTYASRCLDGADGDRSPHGMRHMLAPRAPTHAPRWRGRARRERPRGSPRAAAGTPTRCGTGRTGRRCPPAERRARPPARQPSLSLSPSAQEEASAPSPRVARSRLVAVLLESVSNLMPAQPQQGSGASAVPLRAT